MPVNPPRINNTVKFENGDLEALFANSKCTSQILNADGNYYIWVELLTFLFLSSRTGFPKQVLVPLGVLEELTKGYVKTFKKIFFYANKNFH